MKRLLTSLCFLILATGCGKLDNPLTPLVDNPISGSDGTASLAGFVRQMTVDGAMPVEGALVELLKNSDVAIAKNARKAARPSDSSLVTQAVTDADGRFQFNGIAFGTYTIRVTKSGFVVYDSGEIQISGDAELDAELKADENGNPSRKRGNGR